MSDLSLHPDHLADLKKSGLTDETIRAAGICTVRPADINKICGPHFSGKVSSVLAFPYHGHNGFTRYKLFPAVQTDNGTLKYFQPPKTGNSLYFPPGLEAILGDVSIPLYVTEGEKKALKATQEGLFCLAMGGLWNWSDASEEKNLIPDFNKITLKGRTIFIVPDNDWLNTDRHGERKNLRQAVHELAYRLIDRGGKVFVIELPEGPEKGLDDYLCAHSAEELKTLLAKEIRKRPIQEMIEQATLEDLPEILKRLTGVKETERAIHVKTLAQKLEVPEVAIKKDVARIKKREAFDVKKLLNVKEETIEIGANLTDLGNARRFVAIHGGDIRYCYLWAKWLVWDGKRWKVDDRGAVIRKAKETIMAIYQEAAKTQDESQRKDLAKHGLKSEAEGKILAMIGLAESEPGIPIVPDDMDRDPWLFNVPNGTLNLKSGELLPHTRENLLTKISPVEYRPETPCPFWQDHLKRIFQGNENLISFVQIALGYSLAGITDERAMFICYGRGHNGKTTTMEIMADILGDYAVRTPTESILIKREGAIPNDLAKLKGGRFVYCSETEEGKRLAESLIKDLTGGDTISARFMRGEWFTFRPEFKLWLSTNHRPVIRGTDDAIWARLRLIPFNFQFPEQERIPRSRLWEKITPELPGILAWAVQGCKDWRQFGLFQPDEVKMATQSYRVEMDILGKFLDERCCINKRAEIAAKELYGAYSKWCEENGERGVSQRVFSVRLTEKGFQNQRTRAGYVWLGIGLDEGETCEAREAREPILHIIREN